MSHSISFTGGSTIPIYVDPEGWQKTVQPIVVKHNILDAVHSTYQYLGAQSTVYQLTFTMYGQGAYDYLLEKLLYGYQFVYTDDRGSSGSFVCADQLSTRRLQALNYDDAWYKVEMRASRLLGSGSLYYQWTAP